MSFNEYQEFLEGKGVAENKIRDAITLMEKFQAYLISREKELESITAEDVHGYAAEMIREETNSYQNFVNILNYGYFLNNHEMIMAVMETLDGWEMFPNLSKQLMDKFGQRFHDAVFDGVGLPPQGLHPKKKPGYIKVLVRRLIQKMGSEKSAEFFKPGLRDKYPGSYIKSQEIYAQTHDIENVLEFKHKSLVDTLTKHFQENTLFFIQPVTEEVIQFVKNDRKISAGILKGNMIEMYKIPYMTHLALSETAKQKRNYHVCHNPMIREALLTEDQPVDPIFCNCSGGFIKNYWEAVLGCRVDVELVDSVIMGGEFCKFNIHLPDHFKE